MKKQLSILLLCFFSLNAFSQQLLKNEELIFFFQTKNKKQLTIVKDKDNAYIQYRFGTGNKIELPFPENKTKESWSLFQYNYYMRGGGKANSGQEIANLTFVKDGFRYLIYQTYFSENEKYETGIIIENLMTKKRSRIKGIYKTVKSNLFFLHQETPLKVEDIGLDF